MPLSHCTLTPIKIITDYENVTFHSNVPNTKNKSSKATVPPPLPSAVPAPPLPSLPPREEPVTPAPPLIYSQTGRQNHLLSPSSQFTEAQRSAEVHFLHHQVLECDSRGHDYTIQDHDITLRIPPGIIPDGQKITLEVAVAMHGPFKFQNNSQPISPILWMCLEEHTKLSKPFQVILPHFLTGLTKEKAAYHQVIFAKANHNDHSLEGGQRKYSFQPCKFEPYFASSAGRHFGILMTDHCCFYCLQANQTRELAMDAGYCLTRIENFISQQRSEVLFSAVYCIPTCLKVDIKTELLIILASSPGLLHLVRKLNFNASTM